MKPEFKPAAIQTNRSFRVNEFDHDVLISPFHFHNEYELMYFEDYGGEILIGFSLFIPQPGDILLIGARIPHAYLSHSPKKINRDQGKQIIFSTEAFGADFLNLPEAISISSLLDSSNGAVLFRNSSVKKKILKYFTGMIHDRPSLQMVKAIAIIELLAFHIDEAELLMQNLENTTMNKKAQSRINKVYTYLVSNFQNHITLKDIAKLVHMTEESISRYFKKHTGKSIFESLNEIRLNNACELLIETDMTISQIAGESGFNNISNFNRKYKIQYNETPKEWRKRTLKSIGV